MGSEHCYSIGERLTSIIIHIIISHALGVGSHKISYTLHNLKNTLLMYIPVLIKGCLASTRLGLSGISGHRPFKYQFKPSSNLVRASLRS
ncbi:hypothetical protein DFP73DRAFT_548355 [Morchella snyderi]|nr:hypothetical protein DFP73DRAFT_548355 [Morchella snyderi]